MGKESGSNGDDDSDCDYDESIVWDCDDGVGVDHDGESWC